MSSCEGENGFLCVYGSYSLKRDEKSYYVPGEVHVYKELFILYSCEV